jgi:hypothetical protein
MRIWPLLHSVVAAIDPSLLDQVTAALAAAGLDGDRIEIVTADEAMTSEEPIGGSGLHGILARFGLSLGDELDAIEQARHELGLGHALILVAVHGDAERERVHEILLENCGHSMRYFGQWTITSLDRGSH